MTHIKAMAVVVPARNEEVRIDGCLRALDQARRHLEAVEADAPDVRIIVAVDRSVDRTARRATSWGAEIVPSNRGRVGGTRALGMQRALAGWSGLDPATGWLACTDADSRVPADWLTTHLRLARNGAEMLLGTVRPDPTELGPEALLAWHERHDLDDGHRHVHGANLGIRADVYLQAGGFRDVAVHEDRMLADAVRRSGHRVVSTGRSPVLTSARLSGRTPAGMAGYLRQLLGEPA